MVAPCPAPETLASLFSGGLSADELTTLDEHLGVCPSCRQRLDALSTPTDFSQWVQGARLNPYPFLAPGLPTGLGRIGRFQVEAELGRGGMGVVFRARDEELRRNVALKVLRLDRDDERTFERFAREARAASSVQHDHLVPVLDVLRTDDGRPVMVMPLVVGPTLRETIRAQTVLSPREAASILRQVADGLEAVHRAGLIHRDLKPANILLDRADGRAKLTDFGLSRPLADGDPITQAGTLMGTPEYMSPEQAKDAATADARSDVYSLGVTLYECLTGVVPFRGSAFEVIGQHETDEPVPVRRLRRVPADLETICLKCLAKQPARRYPAAAALRDDLDRWLRGEPTLARPPGTVELALSWCRRNPWPVTLLAVSLLGASGTALGWWRASVNATLAGERADAAAIATATADQQRRLADERAVMALGTITTLIQTQSRMANTPGTLELRKQMTQAALADLRKLSAAVEQVPGADRQTMLAHQKLGDAYNLLGESESAFAEWEQVIAIGLRRLLDHPGDLSTARDVSYAHYSIGFNRNRIGQYAAAAEHHDAALRLLTPIHDANPTDLAVMDSLGIVLSGVATNHFSMDRTRAGLSALERAVSLDERYLARQPDDTRVLSNCSIKKRTIGVLHLETFHDYPAAEKVARGQLIVAARQLERTPNDAGWRRDLRHSHLVLITALLRQGRFAEAEPLARNNLTATTEAMRADPGNVQLLREQGIALSLVGQSMLGVGRAAEAKAEFLKRLALLESAAPSSPQAAILAVDLYPACDEVLNAAIRSGDFEEADRAVQKASVFLKRRPNLTPEQSRNIDSIAATIRKAIQAFPECLTNPAVAARLPDESAVHAMLIRVIQRSLRGELETADQELKQAERRFPNHVLCWKARACVEGYAAGRTTDAAERRRRITSGVAALLRAIELDSSTLETMHLAPEWNSLRADESFRRELSARLRKRYPADPSSEVSTESP
jgi:tetratricopeptide (TPR) repeat protein